MKALALTGAAIALLAWTWLSYSRRRRRRKEVASFAAKYHFEYSTGDPFNLLWDYNLPLLEMGDKRGTENVLSGTWKGTRFIATDYWFATQSSNSTKAQPRSYRRFSVAIVDVPANFPTLTVERETIAMRIAGDQGLRDIQFESATFNRSFRVTCADRVFAFKLIDARMMQWLLQTDHNFGFQLHKDALIVFSKQLEPKRLLSLIGTAKELRDHIPRLVWADYGTRASEAAGDG